jgi:hypothetical protein
MVKQSIKQIPRQDVIVIVIEESNRESVFLILFLFLILKLFTL